MIKRGQSGEAVREEGMYVCDDGCERRHYKEGEQFLTCAVSGTATRWAKIEEQ